MRTGWQTSVNIHGRCGGSLFLKKDVFEIHLNGAGCVWGGGGGGEQTAGTCFNTDIPMFGRSGRGTLPKLAQRKCVV